MPRVLSLADRKKESHYFDMLLAINPSSYFDLSANSIDEIMLVEDLDNQTCRVTSRNRPQVRYKGFKITDNPKVNLLCDVSFYKSRHTAKYIPRLTFVKVDTEFAIKEQERQKVRIDLSGSEDAENFWKIIGFLFEFKHLVDVDAFDKKYQVLQHDAYVIEFESKEQAAKVRALVELFKKANLSDIEIETVLRETRQRDLKTFDFLMATEDNWKRYQTKYRDQIIGEGEEAVWHHFLKRHHWFLGLNADIRFIKDLISEGNVGVQSTTGSGSPFADFIGLSDYTKLIELKTPYTNIFTSTRRKSARANTWSFSSELIDGVSQCLGQKFDWDKTSKLKDLILDGHLVDQNQYRTVDPKAIFIIGNKTRELPLDSGDPEVLLKRDTFERFRRNSRNVDIITFDELYERAEFILRDHAPSKPIESANVITRGAH
jgi:hypothetical protein